MGSKVVYTGTQGFCAAFKDTVWTLRWAFQALKWYKLLGAMYGISNGLFGLSGSLYEHWIMHTRITQEGLLYRRGAEEELQVPPILSRPGVVCKQTFVRVVIKWNHFKQ